MAESLLLLPNGSRFLATPCQLICADGGARTALRRTKPHPGTCDGWPRATCAAPPLREQPRSGNSSAGGP
eukprot:1203544-Alexandrium_andersonii.AAC.1